MEKKGAFKWGDLVIVGLIIVVVIAGFGIKFARQSEGGKAVAEIRVDGVVVDSLDLNTDLEKDYNTVYGYNHVSIKNGQVSITKSDCRNQICVYTKPASKNGDSIVCIPNRFTIEVINDGEEDVIDAVSE